MKLSIIIVNWNTRELLAQCLHSVLEEIRSSEDLGAETIVVDNASRDGSAEMVRRRFPSVGLIENSANAGFARANNQAIRQSSGEYLLLLNPDTSLGPGSLRILVRVLEEHPEAGGAGARLLNADGSLQVSCYPAPTLFREFWRLFHLDFLLTVSTYRTADWDLVTPRQVDVLQGACLILRREALRHEVLDEGYFIYSEDVDLCRRLRREGWRFYWVPGAEVVHYGARSTSQVAAHMFLRLYQGKVVYFRKHHGRGTAEVYKLILLAASLARQLLGPLAVLKHPRARQKDLALARHYRQLMKALPRF